MIRLLRLAVVPLFLPVLSGCVHLHVPERKETSEKLQSELQKYGEGSPAMYEAMRTNVAKFAVHEDAVLSQLGEAASTAMINELPTLNSQQIYKFENPESKQDTSRVGIARRHLEALEAKLVTETKKAQTEGTNAKVAITSAKTAIQALQAEVKSARLDVEQWNQAVAALKVTASAIPAATEKKADPQDVASSLGAVWNTEVTYDDADGKPAKKKLGAILQENVKLSGGDERAWKGFQPPGIKLRIILLGLQVAEAERDRAQMRLTRATERQIVMNDMFREVQLANALLAEAVSNRPPTFGENAIVSEWIETNSSAGGKARATYFEKVPPPVEAPGPTTPLVGGPLPILQHSRVAVNETALLLKSLRLLVAARMIETRNTARVDVEIGRLNHLDSILISKHNDRIWQLFLKAGADGLFAYHKGGFTKEDAAQIVRIAQAVSVGIIAHK